MRKMSKNTIKKNSPDLFMNCIKLELLRYKVFLSWLFWHSGQSKKLLGIRKISFTLVHTEFPVFQFTQKTEEKKRNILMSS